jgi:hypothetical protein
MRYSSYKTICLLLISYIEYSVSSTLNFMILIEIKHIYLQVFKGDFQLQSTLFFNTLYRTHYIFFFKKKPHYSSRQSGRLVIDMYLFRI